MTATMLILWIILGSEAAIPSSISAIATLSVVNVTHANMQNDQIGLYLLIALLIHIFTEVKAQFFLPKQAHTNILRQFFYLKTGLRALAKTLLIWEN